MRRQRETAADKGFRAATGRTPDVLRRPAPAKLAELRKADRTLAADRKLLAQRVGVSERTLRRWEGGRGVAPASQRKLDAAVRETLVARGKVRADRGAVRKGAGTVGYELTAASLKVGSKEAARSRKVTLVPGVGGVTTADITAIDQAVASGDQAALISALQRAVGDYVDMPDEDYPVEIVITGQTSIKRVSR
jgi:DNA-binding transcriptional regulator YiaG